jgi:hypothetical protein
MINKTQRNFSLLAVALVMALAFTACDKSKSQSTGSGDNSAPVAVDVTPSKSPFEGTWRFTVPGVGYTDMIFTGNEWVQTVNGEDYRKGTFTYTATDITRTATHEWDGKKWTDESGSPTTVSYTISGNTLTVTEKGEAMDFVKQP